MTLTDLTHENTALRQQLAHLHEHIQEQREVIRAVQDCESSALRGWARAEAEADKLRQRVTELEKALSDKWHTTDHPSLKVRHDSEPND